MYSIRGGETEGIRSHTHGTTGEIFCLPGLRTSRSCKISSLVFKCLNSRVADQRFNRKLLSQSVEWFWDLLSGIFPERWEMFLQFFVSFKGQIKLAQFRSRSAACCRQNVEEVRHFPFTSQEVACRPSDTTLLALLY